MIADIPVFLVVLLLVARGYKRGLLRSLMGIVSYAVSICVAIVLYPVISDLVAGTGAFAKLSEFIKTNYVLKHMSTDGQMTGFMAGYFDKIIKSAENSAAELAARGMAELLVNILSFIAVLIVSKLLIMWISHILRVFSRLPIIRQADGIGGAILGSAEGILLLYIVFAIIVMCVPESKSQRLQNSVAQSMFAENLCEDNFIVNLIPERKNSNEQSGT